MAKELLRVEHIGMKFNLSKERVNDFREYVIRMLKGKKLEKDEFWALKDINFSIHEGERIGILGLNGAGKSTLLKVVAGVFKPTEGRVIRNGKIVPLLELGAGFDKNYTGRENIFLYGAVLGYGRQYMEEKYDQIVEFSGLEDFMDVPIKNYSSGMKSKLGFAIATIAEPEILILALRRLRLHRQADPAEYRHYPLCFPVVHAVYHPRYHRRLPLPFCHL